MERWRMQVWMLWALAIPSVRPQGANFLSSFVNLDYTCLVPAKENRSLNETEAGSMIAKLLFTQNAALGTSRSELVKERCGQEPAALQPACEEVANDMLTTVDKNRGVICANFTWDNVSDYCRDVQPGFFCAFVSDTSRDPDTCVAMNGSSALAVVCPAGFSCPVGKDHQPQVCPKGYHCPEGTVDKLTCPIGSFCPIASLSIPCYGGEDARVKARLSGLECVPEHNRTLLPKPCTRGNFCVNGLPEECPAHHFCSQGISVPAKCGKTEICPPGSSFPIRWARAVTEFLVGLICYGVALYTLEMWCIAPKMWWVRLLLYASGIVAITAYQVYRSVALEGQQTIYLPTIYLGSVFLLILYGTFFTKVTENTFGRYSVIFEISIFCGGAVFAGWLIGDLHAGYFVAVLFPSVSIAREVFAEGNVDVVTKLGLLVGAIIACLSIVALLGAPRRALLYSGVMSCLLVFHSVRHWCLKWRSLRNQRKRARTPSSAASTPLRFSTRNSTRLTEDTQDVEEPNSRMQPFDVDEPVVSIEHSSSETFCGIGLKLQDVSLSVGPQIILDHITLSIPAGSSVAVMGPSGCGKSSITNVLSGRAGYGKVKGTILINGSDAISINELQSVTGFVAQDDVMHGNLTVEENVNFSAQLRLPQRGPRSREARAEQVDKATTKVLDQFGLGDPTLRATRIGDENQRGVSGGQRKRVSIAMEFVAKPSLLFLDEPTSGLDSTTSHHVVEVFTKAARHSMCTTTAVIHQPRYETMMLFDQLILLAAGGFLVYAGKTSRVENYFSTSLLAKFPDKSNPADNLLDVMTLDQAKKKMANGDMRICNGYERFKRDEFGKWLAKLWSSSSDNEAQYI